MAQIIEPGKICTMEWVRRSNGSAALIDTQTYGTDFITSAAEVGEKIHITEGFFKVVLEYTAD